MDPRLYFSIQDLIKFFHNLPEHSFLGIPIWIVPFLATVVAFLSVAVAVYSVYQAWATAAKQLDALFRQHARTEWNGMMDTCVTRPDFIDAAFTTNFDSPSYSDTELIQSYHAFCYRAWSLVDYLIRTKFIVSLSDPSLNKDGLYETMVLWVVAFHSKWLNLNPYMFPSSEFWRIYQEARKEPLVVFQNHGLPTLREKKPGGTDRINWDQVAENYHDRILGPWSPEMMESKDGQPRRNFLLFEYDKYVDTLPSDRRSELEVLDYGCGPGTMLDYLDGRLRKISGLDNSATALKIAKLKAHEIGITKGKLDFCGIERSMLDYRGPKNFDVIISTNAILPDRREDIQRIFSNMHAILKDDGRMFLILPSFEACKTLVRYWEENFKKHKDKKFADKCIDAFKKAKKYDENNFSYADDGINPQCFHTEGTIKEDMHKTGFEIIGEIKRIKYPWKYAERFDYGNFADAEEEIWDWYVEAKKSAIPPTSAAA